MSKDVPDYEALRLTAGLVEELSHDIAFAQMLVNSASIAEVETLKALIRRARELRGNLPPPLRAQQKNLKIMDRQLKRKSGRKIKDERRTFRIGRG